MGCNDNKHLERKRTGQEPDRVKIEGDWEEAIERALAKMGTRNSTTTGRKSGFLVLLIIMVGLIVVAVYFPYEAPIGDKAAKVVQDAELQSKRKAWIQEAVAKGIFYKVDASGRLPQLWVTPTFTSTGI